MHIDKDVWNSLTPAQRAAVERAAKDSLIESYKANESLECAKLKDILDINKGVHQRDVDGSRRLLNGKPVSAAMTLARWPDDALKVLKEATDDYLAALSGPAEGKADAQKDFTRFYTALSQYLKNIGATQFDPGTFPGKSGLKVGEQCQLVK